MTHPLKFRRFFWIAIIATLMILCLDFISIYCLWSGDFHHEHIQDILGRIWMIVIWPALFFPMAQGLTAFLTVTVVPALFWAFIIELFFVLKARLQK